MKEKREVAEEAVSRESQVKPNPKMVQLQLKLVKDLKSNKVLTKQYMKWLRGDF